MNIQKYYPLNRLRGALLLLIFTFAPGAATHADSMEEAKAVQKKAAMSMQRLHQAMEDGRDVSGIVPMMKQVKVLGDAQKIGEANRLLDEILLSFRRLEEDGAHDPEAIFQHNRKVEIIGLDFSAMEPFISRDGRYLFFNSEKNDPAGGDKNIYYAERIDDYTFNYMGEVEGVNSHIVDGVPTMDRDYNFYFVSVVNYNRQNKFNTVYRGRFRVGRVEDIRPVLELSIETPGWLNMDIEISADGSTLYATQTWFGDGPPPTKSYFFVARLEGDRFVVDQNSDEIFKHINSDDLEYAASISSNGREIFFTRGSDFKTSPTFASYRATRADIHSPFDPPEQITAITGMAEAPAVTDDGRLIYYHKKAGDRFHIFALERTR